jgi:hypothetical protein
MNAATPKTRASRSSRWRRVLIVFIGVVVVLLLAIRFVASPVVTKIANQKLRTLDGFTGHVDAVTIKPWRAALEIDNFTLHERGFENDLPLVRVKKVALSTAAAGFLRGKIAGESVMEEAEFTTVKREQFAGPIDAAKKVTEKAEQAQDEAKQWQVVLREAFPMEITRFEMKNSRARFVDRTHQPNVDVRLDQLRIVVTGLTNRRKNNDDPLPMKMEMSGVTTGNGQLKTRLQADPFATPLRFDVEFELRELSLPPNNAFLQAYAGADVSRGSFELYLTAHAEGGGYQGRVKPFFRDLDFKNASDENKNLGSRIKETVVNAATSILKNDDTQKVATETPFSGTFEQNDVDLWTAVQNLLSNSFVRALREGFAAETPSK